MGIRKPNRWRDLKKEQRKGAQKTETKKEIAGRQKHKKIKLRGALGQSLEKFTHNRSLGRV